MRRLLSLAPAAIAVFVGVLASAGCDAEKITEVVVVIRTDYRVGSDQDALEEISLVVLSSALEGSIPFLRTYSLTGPDAVTMPATLGIQGSARDLSTLHIAVEGHVVPDRLITQNREFSFVPNERRALVIDLERACENVSCADGATTCSAGRCVPSEIFAADLPPYPPPPRVLEDAGPPPVEDACVPGPELCDGLDNDCDAQTDEPEDHVRSPEHCQTCGHVCPDTDNGDPACAEGSSGGFGCTFTCDANFELCFVGGGQSCVPTGTCPR